MQNVLAHIDGQRQQFEADLFELLRIPSVSADPAYAPQVKNAAGWVRDQLSGMGLAAEVIETGGHAIVYAESPPVP
ncbi:MAG TPA: peptidase M20, partial [Lacipirellula sp.]